MYEIVHGAAHHLAAENITNPGEGNAYYWHLRNTWHNVLEVLKICTTVCASDVQKGLKIEMSLLKKNQNYELFCHGTTDNLKYRLCSEIDTSTESYYTAFVTIWQRWAALFFWGVRFR